MAWEIYTFGSGDYLYEVFNGIAALVGSQSYIKLIAISASIALMWALLESAFTNQFKHTVVWGMSMMLVYNIMFLPKVTVVINDPVNKSYRYRSVDNVPAALGIFASLSSQVGYRLTEIMETAFSLPDDLKYHKSGMLFGSRLINLTSGVKIADSNFAASINSYMKQCVFYDLLLHRYNLEELKNSPDIWAFLKENPAKARSFEIRSNTGIEIKTCADGILMLERKWKGETDKATSTISSILTPISAMAASPGNSAARTLFLSSLPQSYNEFFNISKDATDILRQNMLINALDSAAADFSNTGTYGTNIYTSVRSNIQTKAAFSASKKQAEDWLPIFKNVLEILFYGSFPLVFLLCLLPIGAQVAKGYFIGFVWLQAWAPLYAILNFIMTGYAVSKSSVLSGGTGLTVASQAGIAAVNQNIAEMAGYMAWFIPFIAAGLAKGMVSATSSLATSVLAVPQAAANAAASEVATGNISLGNFSMGNGNYGNTSANKFSDSSSFDSGRMQTSNFAGGQTSMTPDGRTVYDQTGSVSRVPNLQITSNETLANSLSQTASTFQNMGENLAVQSAMSKAKSLDQLSQYMASHSVNENHGIRFADHASSEVREAYNRIEMAGNELARNHKIDKATAFSTVLGGNLGLGNGGAGGGGGTKGFGFGLSASATGSSDARSSVGYTDVERVNKNIQLQKDVGTVMNAISDRSLEFADSHANALNNSISEGVSESTRLENQSRVYYDLSKNMSKQAQLVQSQSLSFNQDLIPQFIDFAKSAKKLNGEALGEEALHIIAKDPANTKALWDSFQKQNSGTHNLNNTFDQAKSIMLGNDLKQDYSTKSDELDIDIDIDIDHPANSITGQRFAAAAENKDINNSFLKSDVSSRISDNKSAIRNVEIDKAGIGKETKEKLKDEALATKVKSLDPSNVFESLGITKKKEKTNFNSNE